ncbi:MAG: hypothetical protein JSU05_13365, partial [Bacteroidetes bacterium]|nr:hypothetical protein [Bacteroidota bacterium]
MALSPRRKKILKRSGWVLLIIAVVLGSFHIWFVNHAEQVIEELVAENSHGKIRLKLKKFRFNYFSHKMELQKAQFITTDTTEANSAYRFNAERIKLELHSFWTLVFQGKPTFDSLILIHPQVEAIRLKSINNNPDEDVSVSKEMGKIWFSINDALNVLEVKRFRVDNGTFTIINKIDTEKKPVTISNIHFLIDKTINEIGDEKKTYTEDPDNMILRTHDQDILLPDGRHRISFRNFYINIKTSQIAIDSCTISAEKTDSTKAAFTV